jgi:hypothetical protein
LSSGIPARIHSLYAINSTNLGISLALTILILMGCLRTRSSRSKRYTTDISQLQRDHSLSKSWTISTYPFPEAVRMAQLFSVEGFTRGS